MAVGWNRALGHRGSSFIAGRSQGRAADDGRCSRDMCRVIMAPRLGFRAQCEVAGIRALLIFNSPAVKVRMGGDSGAHPCATSHFSCRELGKAGHVRLRTWCPPAH